MKTITEYLQKGHITTIYKIPTITYHDENNFESWVSAHIDNKYVDFDISKFLKQNKTDGIDLNLYFEKSQEYLHLRRLFNKGSNNEYALCMIYDCDEDFPKDAAWNHEGNCITIWQMDTRFTDEKLFTLFIDCINININELLI